MRSLIFKVQIEIPFSTIKKSSVIAAKFIFRSVYDFRPSELMTFWICASRRRVSLFRSGSWWWWRWWRDDTGHVCAAIYTLHQCSIYIDVITFANQRQLTQWSLYRLPVHSYTHGIHMFCIHMEFALVTCQKLLFALAYYWLSIETIYDSSFQNRLYNLSWFKRYI